MPHPERACELALGSVDGLMIFEIGGRQRSSRARRCVQTRMIDATVLERHGLTPDEYDRIVQFLGREPNLTELGIFSVMWSEHCSYKSSRVHLKTLPTDGPQVLQGPAKTPAPSTSATASRRSSRSSRTITRPSSSRTRAPRPASAASSAISSRWARVRSRCSIRFDSAPSTRRARRASWRASSRASPATATASAFRPSAARSAFEPCYAGNPLVNVFCLGVARASDIIKGVASGVGNSVYYVGAKTGRDGIHGATMASAEFDEHSAEKRPAVQVGDPFMEKLLLEACLEVMQTDALIGIQDMGAAA